MKIGGWWKAKIPPHKHIIAAYGAAITGVPSQIAYGGWQKSATAAIALSFYLDLLVIIAFYWRISQ